MSAVVRSGVSGCGLFLTVCFELEHLGEEQELDVMTAVSVVRRSRPQFITGQVGGTGQTTRCVTVCTRKPAFSRWCGAPCTCSVRLSGCVNWRT